MQQIGIILPVLIRSHLSQLCRLQRLISSVLISKDAEGCIGFFFRDLFFFIAVYPREMVDYQVTVFTADATLAATFNRIFIKLVGTEGESKRQWLISLKGPAAFMRAAVRPSSLSALEQGYVRSKSPPFFGNHMCDKNAVLLTSVLFLTIIKEEDEFITHASFSSLICLRCRPSP